MVVSGSEHLTLTFDGDACDKWVTVNRDGVTMRKQQYTQWASTHEKLGGWGGLGGVKVDRNIIM